MQNNKLQELTDKLYNEGLSKGQAEGEAIVAKAKEEAEKILKEAHSEAEAIIAHANKDAADYASKVTGDLKLASEQTLQSAKKGLENLIVGSITNSATSKALSSEEFVKEIIKAVAEKFSTEDAVDLQLVLPASLQAGLEPFIASELEKILKGGITASFSKKLSGGFTIGPKDGSYFISFTDETFKTLIGEYLRPATKKLLFGE